MGSHEPAARHRGGGGGRDGTSLPGRERDALAQGKPEVTTFTVTLLLNPHIWVAPLNVKYELFSLRGSNICTLAKVRSELNTCN